MAINEPPYTIKLLMYPDANPAASPHLWGETVDISSKVRHPGSDGGQAIQYTYGRGDEARNVDASTMSLTLDNRGGEFSTKNVLGAYYGRIKRNTPIQMGMVSGYDTFSRVSGAGITTSDSGNNYGLGSYWTMDGSRAVCTTTAANQASPAILIGSGSADYDAVFTTSVNVAVTGANVMSCGTQYTNLGIALLFCAEFGPAGVVSTRILRVGTGGATVTPTTATVYTYTPGQLFKVRFARTGSNVRMKVWPAASAEPAAWQASASETQTPPSDLGFYVWRLIGNTNVGDVVVGVDDYTSTAIEFTGTVVQWPVRWNKSGSNCWAPIQAAGILRRLQQGNPPIDSPLTRQLPAYAPTGYWPLEDASEAAVFANVVSKGSPATFTSVSPASDSTLNGSSSAPVFTAAIGAIRASTRARHTSDGFSAMFIIKMASLPATKTSFAYVYATGRVVQWVLSIDSANFYTDGYDSSGALVTSSGTIFSPLVPLGNWVAWQLETAIAGANTNWSLIGHNVGSVEYYAQTGSYASTVISHATGLVVGGVAMNGTAVSQMWMGPNTLPFVDDTFSLVSDGYRGELASVRIARLCLEEGIPLVLEAGSSVPLGAQNQNTILDALRSAESSDYGILYERGAGLGFRPHSARYGRPVDLALSVAAGQVAEPPEPIDDDQMVRNLWRVDREQGSYAVAKDAAHILREGYYPDQKTINVRGDELLLDHASWCLYIGTRPELRWPGITLNFARSASVAYLWRMRSFGPRMTITTGRSQVTGSDPDVIIEGMSGTLSPREWKVTLNCSGARPFDIAALEAGVRADAESSTLDVAVATAVATTIQVTNNGDTGSTWAPTATYPGEVPFDINVNGEVMTVTNVSAIFSTTKQTLTVTRGVNGGAKAHAAGLSVSLDRPTYVVL